MQLSSPSARRRSTICPSLMVEQYVSVPISLPVAELTSALTQAVQPNPRGSCNGRDARTSCGEEVLTNTQSSWSRMLDLGWRLERQVGPLGAHELRHRSVAVGNAAGGKRKHSTADQPNMNELAPPHREPYAEQKRQRNFAAPLSAINNC